VTDSASELQVYMRIYVRYGYVMKIPSGIWVNPKRWSKKYWITIPAIPGDEQPQLINKKEKLTQLTRFIDDELKKVEDRSVIYQDWGVGKVKEFNKPPKATKQEDPANFFALIERYKAEHRFSKYRLKHLSVIVRCLMRFELYKRAKDKSTFRLNIHKITPDLIGAMSGHKEGSKVFAQYRYIDEDIKREVVNLLE
jgi:hypothetical protein